MLLDLLRELAASSSAVRVALCARLSRRRRVVERVEHQQDTSDRRVDVIPSVA